MKHYLFCVAVSVFLFTPSLFAASDDDRDGGNPQAIPFVFVGNAAECGGVAGSRIVTSEWLSGMGLPDDSSSNVPAGSRDPHFGLLLSKNGSTPNCAAAGARITGVKKTTITELGFDYRNGGHCGAGAPRFNLVTEDGVLHFIGGCANGTKSPAPQDPLEWTRVRLDTSNPAQAFPPVAPGAKIKSLTIIYDEGTDTPTTEDPRGVGLAVIDNIDINGQLITRGPGGENSEHQKD